MDVIDIVYEKHSVYNVCVMQKIVDFVCLLFCYNTKNHLYMLKFSHKVTKVLFY